MSNLRSIIQSNDHHKLVSALLQCCNKNRADNEIKIDVDNSSYSEQSLENTDLAQLQTLKELLQKATLEISALISKIQHNTKSQVVKIDMTSDSGDIVRSAVSSDTSSGPVVLTLEEGQFIEPRGRLKVEISPSGMSLHGKVLSGFLSWANVRHVMLVENPTSAKKEGEDLLIVQLHSPIKNNNKDIKNFVWILSRSVAKPLTITSLDISGSESTVILELLHLYWQSLPGVKNRIISPRPDLFASITNPKKLFIRCYRGIQEGVLFAMSNGLLFLKPMLFIYRDEIASLSAGRGGASGSTRYIDLLIETADGKTIEFTNIEREELPALQGYMKGYLEAKRKREEKKLLKQEKLSSGDDIIEVISPNAKGNERKESKQIEAVEQDNEEDDDSDDEDDEDYDPDATGSDESGSDSDSESSNSNDSGSDDDDDDDYSAKNKVINKAKRNLKAENTSPKKKKKVKPECSTTQDVDMLIVEDNEIEVID